ncbi:MAG: hypothetical protein RLZZ215_2659 [Pseudomonadota bacterium]|jgi:hypothetical protein
MSITELLPAVATLSHADKFQLVQFVLAQLAQEDGISLEIPGGKNFDPRRYFGVASRTQQEVDNYLVSAREGWN